MRNKISITTLIICIMMLFCAIPVMGDDSTTIDSSGNVFASDERMVWSENVKNELFIFGQTVEIEDTSVDGSAFSAGYDLSVEDSKIGGSGYFAGYNVDINSSFNNNVYSAGYDVDFGENTKSKGLYVAGNNIDVNGKYDGVNIAGNAVYFNAKVTGDVNIEGNSITFGENAEINGTLTVVASVEPDIPDSVKVSNYKFVKVEKEEAGAENVADVAKKSIGFIFFKKMKSFIYWSVAFILLAYVFNLFFRKQMDESVEMSKKRTAPFIVSGLVGIVAVPIAIILMSVTIVGLPVAGLTFIFFALIKLFSIPFTFATFVREIIFTNTKKRLNPYAELAIAVLPAALLKQIPIVGGLMKLACFVYALGYALQAGYCILKNNKAEKIENSAEAPCAEETKTEESVENN